MDSADVTKRHILSHATSKELTDRTSESGVLHEMSNTSVVEKGRHFNHLKLQCK